MERIITSVKKADLNNPKYQNANKKRPLYEVNAIIDGVKKRFSAYADTESFLEILDDLEKYLEDCEIKLENEAYEYSKNNKFKYNLIGLPFYGLAVFAFAVGLFMPELLGFLTIISSVGIAFATWYFANDKVYYTSELKSRIESLCKRQENVESLKKTCQKSISMRKSKEKLQMNRRIAEKIVIEREVWRQKQRNYKELDAELIRRNLPPEQREKLASDTPKKTKFKNDVPDFIREKMESEKIREQVMNGEYDKEYDVLERTGRKR